MEVMPNRTFPPSVLGMPRDRMQMRRLRFVGSGYVPTCSRMAQCPLWGSVCVFEGA